MDPNQGKETGNTRKIKTGGSFNQEDSAPARREFRCKSESLHHKNERRKSMTIFILILCALVFGAICLGVGYLFGKKKKVIAQISAQVNKASSIASTVVEDVKKG